MVKFIWKCRIYKDNMCVVNLVPYKFYNDFIQTNIDGIYLALRWMKAVCKIKDIITLVMIKKTMNLYLHFDFVDLYQNELCIPIILLESLFVYIYE